MQQIQGLKALLFKVSVLNHKVEKFVESGVIFRFDFTVSFSLMGIFRRAIDAGRKDFWKYGYPQKKALFIRIS
jgi:hypothetical protein